MSLRFLLDTNVLSEPIRPSPNQHVMARLERHVGQLATASVVWHELLFGLAAMPHGRRRREGEQYLQLAVAKNIPVLPYDQDAATWHAQQRGRLKALGHPTSFADGQIAAVAAVNGLTLVTANSADFSHFTGLQLADWTD